MTPSALTRPYWGFSPTTPHCDAGSRMDPAVSVPMAAKPSPAATAVADPPEDPPAMFVNIPGVSDFAEAADHRTAPVGEFMKILLTEEYGARALQPDNNVSIFRRNALTKQIARCGGRYARGIDDVFKADGDAVHRSQPLAALNSFFRGFGLGES